MLLLTIILEYLRLDIVHLLQKLFLPLFGGHSSLPWGFGVFNGARLSSNWLGLDYWL
jgi:hypothetical protein